MKVTDLLSALEGACFRPLFVEIALVERRRREEREQRRQDFEDELHKQLQQQASLLAHQDPVRGSAEHDGTPIEEESSPGKLTQRDGGGTDSTAPSPPTSSSPLDSTTTATPRDSTTNKGAALVPATTSQRQAPNTGSTGGSGTFDDAKGLESRNVARGKQFVGPSGEARNKATTSPRKDPTTTWGAGQARRREHCNRRVDKETLLKDETWEQLLARAASAAVSSLTESEYAEILRLASILLLGFLLPYSTGTPTKLLRHALRRRLPPTGRGLEQEGREGNPTTNGRTMGKFDPIRYALDMPLEERMEQSIQRWASNAHGELGEEEEIHNESYVAAFHGFVSHGLAPLLQSRPIPIADCDLIPAIAMAIHPSPGPELNPITNRLLNQHNSVIWRRTKALMSSPHASQFHIHYETRRALVRLVRDALRLPPLPEISDAPTHLLLHGPIPHLRASIRAFGRSTARRADDVHCAHTALVNLAIDSNHPKIIDEEWSYLLHALAEDRSGHMELRGVPYGSTDLTAAAATKSVCLFSARGVLLAEFLSRLFRSSGTAPSKDRLLFMNRAARSLSDAIEWQVDCWTLPVGDSVQGDDKPGPAPSVPEHPAELLAALVSAAGMILRYHPLPEKEPQSDAGNDDEPFSALTNTCTYLLGHPNQIVAHAASDASTISFRRTISDRQASLLFRVLQSWLDRHMTVSPAPQTQFLDRVVAISSQQSPVFAHVLIRYLLKTLRVSPEASVRGDLCRFLSVASSNQPLVASKEKDEIASLLKAPLIAGQSRLQVAACILSLRHDRFFDDESQASEAGLLQLLMQGSETVPCWDAYRLACHALRTGNYSIAAKWFRSLLRVPTLSERHYLWIQALSSVAEAESMLVKEGAVGIPPATIKLRSSQSQLRSFECMTFTGAHSNVEFQRRYLLLRLDFLDLVTVFRQLAMEMRLTGSAPHRRTRPFVHAQNLAKAFIALSDRYTKFHQCHGLVFQSLQSSSVLRLFAVSCLFMAQAVIGCFADSLPTSMNHRVFTSSLLDSSERHPLAMLMRRLHELVFVPMHSAQGMTPLLRAAATLELLDSMLLVPAPFCIDFTLPTPKHVSFQLLLAPDPDEHRECMTEPVGMIQHEPSTIESTPSLAFTVICRGRFLTPQNRLRDPVWEVLVRYRIKYCGPLEDEGENAAGVEDKSDGAATDLSVVVPPAAGEAATFVEIRCDDPVVIPLSSSEGRFHASILCPPLVDEGMYALHADLTCRDSFGREWHVELEEGSRSWIAIRTSRSR